MPGGPQADPAQTIIKELFIYNYAQTLDEGTCVSFGAGSQTVYMNCLNSSTVYVEVSHIVHGNHAMEHFVWDKQNASMNSL